MELPEFIKLNPTGGIVWLACSDGRASVPGLSGASLHEIRVPGGVLCPELGTAGTLNERIVDLVSCVKTMVRIKEAAMVVISLHDHCAAQKDILKLEDEDVVRRAVEFVQALKDGGVDVDIHIVHKHHCERGSHLGWRLPRRGVLQAA